MPSFSEEPFSACNRVQGLGFFRQPGPGKFKLKWNLCKDIYTALVRWGHVGFRFRSGEGIC